MNWDNSTVIKFLELYQINSCIWDPQNKSHKNRQCVNDAWNNIRQNLGVPCTVKDLKKKKESLMSAYRNYKSKIKKSERRGSGSSDIYQPTWFAFSCMDGFLGSVYSCNKEATSTEDEETIEDTDTTNTIVTDELNESNPTTSNQKSSPMKVRKRQKNPPELIEAKQHMEKAFNFMKRVSQEQYHPKNIDDECTIYGQLIARKMQKLSQERRDVMMVNINQLFLDEHMLNSSRRPNSSTTTYTPSPTTFQEVYSPQSQTQTATIEESVDFPSVHTRQYNPNPIHGGSEKPSTTVEESSHSTRSYNTREYIIPNTIDDDSADTLKDFVLIIPK